MLQQVCEHLHNYFIKDRHTGTFTIAGGTVTWEDVFRDRLNRWRKVAF